ncbi:MAG: sulfotransferase [Proteobacteria bacterium]|nr:sulfotransferase [Pseudomonadota bacterium]MBU1736840.1 sulfotransferase [Pseudomonadota bacterium]
MIMNKVANLRFRLLRQADIYTEDTRRWWQWHIAGGKHYYTEHYREILSGHKWVFIVGCNNSGTTLLQKALEKCGLVSTMKYEGQRHTRTLPRAYRYGFDRIWSEYADDLLLPQTGTAVLIPRLLHDWMNALPKPPKRIIVEKTPANVLRMDFLNHHFPQAYFIGLVRNGYAVCEGIKRKSGHSVERAARHWRRAGEALEENRQKVKNYLEIRYEDLADNMPGCAARLGEFLEVDAEAIAEVEHKTFSLATVTGCATQSLRNLNRESIDRLTRDEIDTIARYAGPLLDYYGYSAENERVAP